MGRRYWLVYAIRIALAFHTTHALLLGMGVAPAGADEGLSYLRASMNLVLLFTLPIWAIQDWLARRDGSRERLRLSRS